MQNIAWAGGIGRNRIENGGAAATDVSRAIAHCRGGILGGHCVAIATDDDEPGQ
jgi:hypothetical protein